ncbi:tRNA(Met) cytidine acetyltransferase TmcA [Salinirarus marinus]|uniref:tRNA(Met) cytidine acetyltransferase TmcA n=1 Tax=Salinirarus marinus TaxID=3068310 RepID=UPI003C6CA1AD
MDLAGLAATLRAEATRANERRLVVLAGDRDTGLAAAHTVVDAADVADAAFVTTRSDAGDDCLHPDHAGRLLGTTREAVVLDAHEAFSPNALGRVVGAVDGGGLLLLLTPPLDDWPARRGNFDATLAVPPFDVDDVTGRFRARLVETLRTHPGVAVVDVDGETVERDGTTDPPPATTDRRVDLPPDRTFPDAAYEACLTTDQAEAVAALERLREPGRAVVVEADRGRGKSSAAGIAAACLAADGRDVLVTAPQFRNASEVFARARETLAALDTVAGDGADDRRLQTDAGGRIRFEEPPTAADLPDDPDVVLVDEAAALPVRLLARFLDAPAAGFCTTVHGYEGAGRGFSVRFRDRLVESDVDVAEVRMDEPIRYAPGDPVEVWAFRALLLDARPAVDQVVADATPETTTYRAVSGAELVEDEELLREVFGLLVLAHYRTEPDDLARLLDAPNVELRVLEHDGWVVSVALLAREGGLSAERRAEMYTGARVRGNMLPDVLTSQLRDPVAAAPVGYRVLRIATHHAVRSTGLGSRLLDRVHDGVADRVDWLGVGFGATQRLLRFWRRNDYRTIHLSTTRNATSGEYSALLLRPTSDAGWALHDRHARWFRNRVADVLLDALDDADPDVVRAALAGTAGRVDVALTAHEWRVVVGAAYGPGLYDTSPGAFRRLALAHLLDGDVELAPRQERLLVRKPLQAAPWDVVAGELDYVSTRQCMRALGEAFQPLVDRYGDEYARAERGRYTD